MEITSNQTLETLRKWRFNLIDVKSDEIVNILEKMGLESFDMHYLQYGEMPSGPVIEIDRLSSANPKRQTDSFMLSKIPSGKRDELAEIFGIMGYKVEKVKGDASRLKLVHPAFENTPAKAPISY